MDLNLHILTGHAAETKPWRVLQKHSVGLRGKARPLLIFS